MGAPNMVRKKPGNSSLTPGVGPKLLPNERA